MKGFLAGWLGWLVAGSLAGTLGEFQCSGTGAPHPPAANLLPPRLVHSASPQGATVWSEPRALPLPARVNCVLLIYSCNSQQNRPGDEGFYFQHCAIYLP